MTKIDLGECEILLRIFYNISINDSLYIKKIDIYQEGMKISKVEYNVYAKLFGKNLVKLNLTICRQSKISIYIPIKINGNLDEFNSTSGYYNDICYATMSEDGTDISLKDRQNEYINKDKVICQENCYFSGYDYNTLIAKCTCEVKECADSFADMNINKDKLLENFKNIKNIINLNFLMCYNKLFNKEGFLKNIGCYILFTIILFHILTILIFCINQFSSIVNKINNILTLSRLSENPLFKQIEIEEKIYKRKSRFKNKKMSHKKINKNISIKKHVNNKKPLNDSKIKIYSKKIENYKERKENYNKFYKFRKMTPYIFYYPCKINFNL